LVWVLAQQAGANSVVIALGGMVALAFAVWLYDTTRNTRPSTERIGTTSAFVILVATLAFGYSSTQETSETAKSDSAEHADRNWEPYSAERLKTLLAEGKPVFLNFTAAWCISCLVNEQVALSNQTVKDKFGTAGITYLKGDWTKRDGEITAVLNQFGRSGVPLYVFYPAGSNAKPVELPQVLTPDIVINIITEASVK